MKLDGANEQFIQTSQVGNQTQGLPRDVFRSRFQYFLTRYRTSLTAIGIELAVYAFTTILSRLTKDTDVIIAVALITVIIGIIVVVATPLIVSDMIHKRTMTRTNTVQFMKEIATVKPGIEAQEWDVVAARMNSVFYSSDSLTTPYFFYDGEACYSYFKNVYLLPYLKRKDSSTSNEDTIYELRPLIDKVLGDYEGRINKDWHRILNEGTSGENQAVGE
ncbi:LAME_0C02212g1_1 [Lachancea meyersii CBS 8951]|uniref:LAME_0C02212g1_1 n=1 Tax=Lachancea meyersii CBS 8951 TaxID=1266667 RepID=A0A1G4IZF3_9SACH|nr:LAME_0C02212g1_1 [Lachancea meyersii CBS 8951]